MPSYPAARQAWLAVASSGVCVILPPPCDVCKRSSGTCAQLCITFMLQADYLQRTQQESHSKLCLAGVHEWVCKNINLVTGNAQHSVLTTSMQLVKSQPSRLNSQLPISWLQIIKIAYVISHVFIYFPFFFLVQQTSDTNLLAEYLNNNFSRLSVTWTPVVISQNYWTHAFISMYQIIFEE